MKLTKTRIVIICLIILAAFSIYISFELRMNNYEPLTKIIEEKKIESFINNNELVVVPPKFDYAEPFSEGLAAVEERGRWGFIDKTGKYVIKPIYNDVSSFKEGLAAVEKNGKFGFILNFK